MTGGPRWAYRRERREEYLTYTLPQTWEGVPEPVVTASMAAPERSAVLTALGGSPGVAEGRVRVMDDPFARDLDDGEVLVCANTDPSWAAQFLVASAVVIDVGGPMSHGAIVARELGIPCVINTRNGTRVLSDGDRVRVDGNQRDGDGALTPPDSDVTGHPSRASLPVYSTSRRNS